MSKCKCGHSFCYREGSKIVWWLGDALDATGMVPGTSPAEGQGGNLCQEDLFFEPVSTLLGIKPEQITRHGDIHTLESLSDKINKKH
jgi:hypothetical protein